MTDPETVASYVIERVRSALACDPRVNELGIAVTIVDRDVFLRGAVSTSERQASITAVVRELLPDHAIHNDVRVDVPAVPLAPERLR
jgi:osmotically-inducible protein OsmY